MFPLATALFLATILLAGATHAAAEVLEIRNPLGFATSITNANNGDLPLIRSRKRVRISDGGRKLEEMEEMPLGIRAVARVNEVRLQNPNRDAAPFNTRYGLKVRRVKLGLRFDDDTEISCPSDDAGVFTSSDEDWPHAEGRRVPLGEDLVWRVAVPNAAP